MKKGSNGSKAAVLLAGILMCAFVPGAGAQEQWRHQIGTGLFGLNINGDIGFGTKAVGPVEVNADLNMSDIMDATESAFGFAGASTNGIWTIFYGAGQLKLEESNDGTTAAGLDADANLDFKDIYAEAGATYKFATTGRNDWGVLGGLRYLKHDYDIDVEVGPQNASRSINNDWVDVLIGATHRFNINEALAWNNRADLGFGGSNGTYHVRSAIDWRVAKSWLISFYGDYKHVDYENGNKGDNDWYKYDVDEFGPGIAFAYMF